MAAAALAALLACAGSAPASRAPRAPGPAAVTAPARAPGEDVAALDLDRDGRPERWAITAGAGGDRRLVRTEHDLDGDGRVDRWDEHGPDGAVVRVIADLDLDGRPDTVLRYDGGTLAGREVHLPGVVPLPAPPAPDTTAPGSPPSAP